MTDAKVMARIEMLVKELEEQRGDPPWIEFHGTCITDPTMSECGRFPIDPCDEYGEHRVLQWIKEAEEACSKTAPMCGLNADWCCRAWHMSSEYEPNLNDGDIYVVDDEGSSPPRFCIVRRWHEEPNDNVEYISESPDLITAMKMGREVAANIEAKL